MCIDIYRKCHNIAQYSSLVTPKLYISIVFSFSWELEWPQEKLKTMLIKNFVSDKHRLLWYVMAFSVVVNCINWFR